jgi:hypothetical protein
MAAIFEDLSMVERATLDKIFRTERADQDVHLEQKEITALTLLQERLLQKDRTDVFVPTELKALAECTGIPWPSSATDKEGQSKKAAANETKPKPNESDDIMWNTTNKWFRTG